MPLGSFCIIAAALTLHNCNKSFSVIFRVTWLTPSLSWLWWIVMHTLHTPSPPTAVESNWTELLLFLKELWRSCNLMTQKLKQPWALQPFHCIKNLNKGVVCKWLFTSAYLQLFSRRCSQAVDQFHPATFPEVSIPQSTSFNPNPSCHTSTFPLNASPLTFSTVSSHHSLIPLAVMTGLLSMPTPLFKANHLNLDCEVGSAAALTPPDPSLLMCT